MYNEENKNNNIQRNEINSEENLSNVYTGSNTSTEQANTEPGEIANRNNTSKADTQNVQPQKKKKKNKFFVKAIAIVLLAFIAGGASGAGAYFVLDMLNLGEDQLTLNNMSQIGNVDLSKTDIVLDAGSSSESGVITDVTRVVDSVMPAMVSINVTSVTTVTSIWGQKQEYEVHGSGSGIIILQDAGTLFIVTNHHVIDAAKSISVTFSDGKSYEATVKGSDSDYDLAVLSVDLSKVEEGTASEIKCAVLGSSETLNLGEPAIAIGNALGYGQSVTVGYISATEREVQMEDKTMVLLQTDAAINPGNSGGALLNIKGEVIGINSSKYSDTNVEGMGFAIPISDAVPIITEIINETVIPEDEQAYLGISGGTVNSSWTSAYGWPEGVYVSTVTQNSPADLGGIQAHDIIVKFDGKDIQTIDSLTEKLKKKTGGDVVEITVMRQNNYGTFEEKVLTVTLKSKKDS